MIDFVIVCSHAHNVVVAVVVVAQSIYNRYSSHIVS